MTTRTTITAIAMGLLLTTPARAAEVMAEGRVNTLFTSNVFLNRDQEWDLTVVPLLSLGVSFADVWAVRYQGRLDAYTQHTDLLSHWHELSLSLSPSWDETALLVRISLDTLRNTSAFAFINHVTPRMEAYLAMEPLAWLRWGLSQQIFYRAYYDDSASSSLDSWTKAFITFTSPTRTTISPRAGFGLRFYPSQAPLINDNLDTQLEVGLHLSQGLWQSAGLQGDYAYLHALGDSGLLLRKLTASQFSYLGEDFLFSGHKAMVGLKQIIAGAVQIFLLCRYELRGFQGWPALDEEGRPLGEERRDHRLTPEAQITYRWMPSPEASAAVPGVTVTANYAYTRQWSNDSWYDTDQHVAMVGLGLDW